MTNATLESTIGLIAGVLVFSVILLASFNAYASTQQTEESFDNFISKINNLENGEQDSFLLALPEDYILVSFDDGKDYSSSENCDEEIEAPLSKCGEYLCICMCSTSWLASTEDACIKKPKYCYTFTTNDITLLSYTSCDGGLYKEGTSGGVQNIYFKKEGTSIIFCDSEECFKQEPAKEVNEDNTSKLFV